MRIVCGNCGDTIEEVDDDYEPTMLERKGLSNGEIIIHHTGTRCCGGSDW